MSGPPIRQDHIFIVGCQRSGTSLVWASLIAHPELKPLHGYDAASGYDPKELYYFRNIFAARHAFASSMYGWDVDRAYMRTIVDATVRFCVEKHGATSGRWVNGFPADALYIEDILEWMPEVRIVYVLRHPQEVIWSALHAPWVDSREGKLSKKEIHQSAQHWRRFAEIALQVEAGRFGDSVLMMRHEDLVTRPEEVSRRMTSHVGVSDHPAVRQQLGGNTFNSSFRNNADPGSVFPETRRAIGEAVPFRRAVVNAVGDLMERLGYRDLGDAPRRLRWRPSAS